MAALFVPAPPFFLKKRPSKGHGVGDRFWVLPSPFHQTGRKTLGRVRGELCEMGGKAEICFGAGRCARMLDGGGRQCPRCESRKVWSNGRNRAGKRGWRCAECGKSFVEARHGIPQEVRLIADRMINENIPPVTIAACLKGWVSPRWVYDRRKKNKGTQ